MAATETAAAQRPAEPDGDAGASQTVRAQARLRELIVGGELAPGARIPELALVERLGVSRTPVRAALLRLQEEGLLEALPGGGFVVREFSETDIHDAIELRGTLEGLAARLAAERGAGAVVLAGLRDCLARIDTLLERDELDDASFATYAEQNGRFHRLLLEACGSVTVRRQAERAAALPFASPNGFVRVGAGAPMARDTLVIAQAQHHAVLQAILRREGARAEALMREHARIARGKLDEALATHHGLQSLPGGGLIRRGDR